MSMYEIEGLVEDSVRLIYKSDLPRLQKRNLLYNLYDFQKLFDTGYTHFRCMGLLLECGFTHRVPLGDHPDYSTNQQYFSLLDIGSNPWIAANIQDKSEAVFAQEEPEGILMYVDAGSGLWHHLCETGVIPEKDQVPPTTLRVVELISRIMHEAEKQDDTALLANWYAILANGYLEFNFAENDGTPKRFLDFIHHETLNKIREIARRHQFFRHADKTDDCALIKLVKLEEELELESDIDRQFILRWLLEPSSSETLIKAYERL